MIASDPRESQLAGWSFSFNENLGFNEGFCTPQLFVCTDLLLFDSISLGEINDNKVITLQKLYVVYMEELKAHSLWH